MRKPRCIYSGVINIAMIEIELASSAIAARADIELFAYDGNDS